MLYTSDFESPNPFWVVAFFCYFFVYMTVNFLDIDVKKLLECLDYLNEYDYEDSCELKPVVVPVVQKKYEDKYLKEYQSRLDTYDNKLSETQINALKNNFILEKTPIGCVIMCFNYNSDNVDTSSFVYYSDHSIPYNYLDTLARKYVITFNCLNLYIDTSKEKEEALNKKKETKQTTQIKEPIKEPIKNPIKESENKKGVFANLKSYNKDSLKVKIESNNNNNDINATNKEVKINRYTSGGKISNFNFIKKVDKHLVNKNYSLSFADFKKMKNKNI